MLFFNPGPVDSRDRAAVDTDQQVKQLADSCNREIVSLFESYVDAGSLTYRQLFDTFYIPIPDTNPPKYRTQYDRVIEKPLQKILDTYLKKHETLIYVMAVDAYGYLPAYHAKYSGAFTDNRQQAYEHNKQKRILNDRVGRAAASSKEAFLVQPVVSGAKKNTFDLSVPIFINTRHWGAVRFGYHKNKDE